MKNILLLEDEVSLNKGISLRLKKEGYEVASAGTIKEARDIFSNKSIDLVLCDITLPDGNGLEFGSYVREHSTSYLIYLTVLDREIDIVNAYDTGADDYITKPCSLQVLVSKVNAVMRRLTAQNVTELESDGIVVSLSTMKVRKAGQEIVLSRIEIGLLNYLLENAGQVLSKEQIMEHVWGINGQFIDDNTVNVNISRLKMKLKTNAISNVRGLGYIWNEEVIKR